MTTQEELVYVTFILMESGGTFQLEWQCPSCTLLNKAVSFKCRVCGTPKGTSTRQSKFHFATLEQQYVAESLRKFQVPKNINKSVQSSYPTSGQSGGYSSGSSTTSKRKSKSRGEKTISNSDNHTRSYGDMNVLPTLMNIDRTTGQSYTVTVNSISVVITEYDILYPDSD